MKAQSIIKGKIALELVETLLQKAGHKVYPFGNAAEVRALLDEYDINRDSEQGRKIAAVPDLVVQTHSRKTVFVEVKFRSDPASLEEELLLERDTLEQFWQAKIIVVTPRKPHFLVLTPPYFKKSKREGWPIPVFTWVALEKDTLLSVSSRLVQAATKMVEKYYKA